MSYDSLHLDVLKDKTGFVQARPRMQCAGLHIKQQVHNLGNSIGMIIGCTKGGLCCPIVQLQ